MNYQKTNTLQLKFGHKYKNLPRLLGGAMKISGCAGNFKVVLKSLKDSAAPFYNGTWRTLLKLYVFKATKTITLVRKKWFFSKILRIQDEQEYLSITIVCDTNIKLYLTSYSTAL